MKSCLGPFGLLFVDFIEELHCEAVCFLVTFSFKCDCRLSKIDFFLTNVSELNLYENSVFSLSPLNERMTKNMILFLTALDLVESI